MATRTEIKPGHKGGGSAEVAAAAATPAPSGPSLGRGPRDLGRSILIDKGGNYISLAFSANPRSPAGGQGARDKEHQAEKRMMEGKGERGTES